MAKTFEDLDAEVFASLDNEAGLSALDVEAAPPTVFPSLPDLDPNKPIGAIENTIPQVDIPRIADPQGISAPSAFPKERSFSERAGEAFQRGQQNISLDFTWRQAKYGLISEEEAFAADKRLAELNESNPIEGRNFAESLLLSTVQVTPGMIRGLGEGVKTGTAFAGAAALAGQVGPQAAFPEEIVTVPGSYVAGQAIGSTKFWSEQGEGAIYGAARKAGVSHKTAALVSSVGGPLYGYIEQSQIDKIIPGLGRAKSGILKLLIAYAKTVGTEVAEEVVQKGVEEIAVKTGRAIEGQIEAADIPAELKDTAKAMLEEGKQAIGPMALLPIPGAAVSVARGVVETTQQDAEIQSEIEQAQGQVDEAGRFIRRDIGDIKAKDEIPPVSDILKEPIAPEDGIPPVSDILKGRTFPPRTPEAEQSIAFPREIPVEPQPAEGIAEPSGAVAGQPPVEAADITPVTIQGQQVEKIGGRLPTPEEGLFVANIGADGKVYVGDASDIHFNLSEQYSEQIRESENLTPGEPTFTSEGFIGPDGVFLTRQEAFEKTNVKPTANMVFEGGTELDALSFKEQGRPMKPDIVTPKLHIGNVTPGMKTRIEAGTGLKAEDIQGFKEGGFPTKKTQIPMARSEAERTLVFIENSLQEKVDNDLIRTENGLRQANVDWADIKALREVLGIPIGARPFREVNISTMTNEEVAGIAEDLEIDIPTTTEIQGREIALTRAQVRDLQERAITDIRRGKVILAPSEAQDIPVKKRVQLAVQPSKGIDSGKTAQQVLDIAMKKAEVSSAKAWLESAKDIVASHKDLAARIKTRLKGVDITAAEQNRLLSLVAKGRTDLEKQKAVAAVEMLAFRAEHRGAVNELKDFMKKLRKERRFGKVELGKLSPEVRGPIKAFFDTFDFSKMSQKKFDELLEREAFVSKMAGNLADLGSNLKDEIGTLLPWMPQSHIDELNRLRKVPIKDLDIDEINYIKTSIEHLVAMGDKAFLEKQSAKAEKENQQKDAAVKEVDSKSKEKGVNVDILGLPGFIPKVLTIQQMTLRTLSSKVTGKTTDATDFFIQDNLRKYEEGKAKVSRQFTEGARAIINKINFTKADSKRLDKKVKVTLGGKSINMDLDNVLSIYQHIKADGNLRQLLRTDGLVILQTERGGPLNVIKKKVVTETGTPTDAELRRIVEIIEGDPKFKALSDAAFKINREVVTPEVNKTSNEYQNFDLNTEKKHWRTVRVFDKKTATRPTETTKVLEEESRRQPKTGGTAKIRIVPFRQELMSSLQADAAYAGGVIPIQDLRILVNSHRWQKAMRDAGRADELDTIIKLVNRIQAFSSDASMIDLFLAEQLNNFGKSVLSLRLTGYGIQTASIPAAYETINSKYFLRARPLISAAEIPRAGVTEMKELSDILWMRWEGRRFNYVTGAVAAQHAFDTMVLQDSPMTDKFLNQYLWGDQKAIYTIYLAAQEKVAAEQGLKKGTKANKEAAMKLTEVALDSQPQWDMVHRNLLTSSPNVPLRGSTIFSSARVAQLNVLQRATIDRVKGRISTAQMLERWGGVFFANVLVQVVRGLVAIGVTSATAALIWASGDEEKAKRIIAESVKKQATKVPLGTVLNLISLPALIGPFAQNTADEVIKRLKTPGLPIRDLQSIRTGNIFVDMTLDASDVVGSFGKMLQLMGTGEVFKSGSDKGKPKWKRERNRFAVSLAELIALRNGLPFSAPRGEIGFRVRQITKDSKGDSKGKKTTFRRRSTSTSGRKTTFRKRTR